MGPRFGEWGKDENLSVCVCVCVCVCVRERERERERWNGREMAILLRFVQVTVFSISVWTGLLCVAGHRDCHSIAFSKLS